MIMAMMAPMFASVVVVVAAAAAAAASTVTTAAAAAASPGFTLPPFSWEAIPRFIHCGPNPPKQTTPPGKVPQLPLAEIYKGMSEFPMATLEKFTMEFDEADSGFANGTHEEEKILAAAKAIKAYNTSTKVIFYHMAWQDFSQFDLYNLTLENAIANHWALTWDNGTVPGVLPNGTASPHGRLTYNLSNPDMRAAWVGGMKAAMGSGYIDGFFIDITPQVSTLPFSLPVSLPPYCLSHCLRTAFLTAFRTAFLTAFSLPPHLLPFSLPFTAFLTAFLTVVSLPPHCLPHCLSHCLSHSRLTASALPFSLPFSLPF